MMEMLHEFVISWDLFHWSYLEGWLVGVLLALVGVVVVARDQIFIGAAVSQASTLGIALALCLAGLFPVPLGSNAASWWAAGLHSDVFQAAIAVAFSVAAALLTARDGPHRRESHEAVTGWIFLVSAALSVLLVSHSPYSLEEIHRVHSSSIIGATAGEVAVFASLCGASLLVLALARSRLLLFATDPSMARSVGMNIGRWSLLVSLWLGLSVGLSIRASGMLYTFGSLVLPPLVAKNVCREVRPMFIVAPLVALVVDAVGFVLANHYDFPPAQMNVALAGLVLLAAWTYRRLRAG